QERALDLELVEGLGMAAPVDLGEPPFDQPGQVLRLSAQLLAHAERLEQGIDLVRALAYKPGDDALVPRRVGTRRGRRVSFGLVGHGRVPSSVPAPPPQTVTLRDSLREIPLARLTGGPAPSSGPPAPWGRTTGSVVLERSGAAGGCSAVQPADQRSPAAGSAG